MYKMVTDLENSNPLEIIPISVKKNIKLISLRENQTKFACRRAFV